MFLNKKLVIALAAVIIAVAAGATAFAVAFTASEKPVSAIVPEQENADENGGTEGEGLSDTACEPEKEYTYLRGTMYKNLYETKYQNLVETTKAKEPVVEMNEGSVGGGSAGSGSVGGGSWINSMGSPE